jgi:hypothetical protein
VGGDGSGRHWTSVKATTSQYYGLDIRRWPRDVLLTPGLAFRTCWVQDGKELISVNVRTELDRVILSYGYRRTDGQTWQSLEYSVRIEWTRCNYGGKRAWFRCPARGCGRRAAILYLGGEFFACRHCYQLVYQCQREPAHARALRKAVAIREKLSVSPAGIVVFPIKPKGMHERTYQRLLTAYKDADARSLPPFLRRLICQRSKDPCSAPEAQRNSVPTALQNELQSKSRRATGDMAKGKSNA